MRVLRGLAIAALIGLLVFFAFAWRITTLETLPPTEAQLRYADVRDGLPPGEPLLTVGPDGTVMRNPAARPASTQRLSTVGFLVYRARDDRLLRLDVPFWFYRFKEPSTRFFLARAGIDLDRLGITSTQLAGHGAGLVLDEARADGNRLLVWLD